MTVLKALKAKSSRSAQVKAQLHHPVIDTDIHTNAYSPALEDYIAQYGGSGVVDLFRTHLKTNDLNALATEWYGAMPRERKDRRFFRPAFWALPSENTYDLVREGAISPEDFKALVFEHPYQFYTANNPDFFKGTVVQAKLKQQTAA